MTDLIALAKQALGDQSIGGALFIFSLSELQAFADLIRKEERQECAKVCDAHEVDQWNLYKGRAPYNGTEEGRADPHVQGASDGAGYCADKIRAREALQAQPVPPPLSMSMFASKADYEAARQALGAQ